MPKPSKTQRLHEEALNHNWDDGVRRLVEIVKDSACDRGTALLIYWNGRPHHFRQYKGADDVPPFERAKYDLLMEISKRYQRSFYRKNGIRFDPRRSPWGDLMRATDDEVRLAKWPIPEPLCRPNLKAESKRSELAKLMSAIVKNQFDEVQRLIEAEGVDIDGGPGSYPLAEAVRRDHAEIVGYLLDKGAETDIKGIRSPLWVAANGNQLDVLRLLVDADAKLDVKDRHYGTPLHTAARNGFTEVTRRLVSAGAKLELTLDNKTPLDLAVSSGHRETAEVLLEGGANVNKGALHWSVLADEPLIDLLVEHGAKVDKTNKAGETALYWAARSGSPKAVEALLRAGADPELARKKDGKKPIDKARDVFARTKADSESKWLPASDRKKAAAKLSSLEAMVGQLQQAAAGD